MDPLPPGDAVLWEASPCWHSLALRLCHLRGVAIYLAVVIAGATSASALDGDTAWQAALTAAPLLLGGAAVLAFLAALAWLVARTTVYTLTTNHVFIRFGIALPVTLGIPFRAIARISVALHPDGTGDLPIETKPGYEIAWRRCWPHARPWRFLRAQPMMRSVPDGGRVAALLARILAEAAHPSPSSPRHRTVTELTPAR